MQKHAPFVNNVHFMAHCTNLVIQTFSGLTLVAKIETLLVGMYNFFTHSIKQALEASKLVELLECKGYKILKNITWFIWFLCCCHPNESWTSTKFFVVKMVVDSALVHIVKAKYELLCDVEMLLGFSCIHCRSLLWGGARFL